MSWHRTWGGRLAILTILVGVGWGGPALAERPFGHYPRPLYFRPSHSIAG